jgi:putative transposase
MLSVVVDEQARAELTTDLDELFREGARRMLAAALEAEVHAYLAAHTELVDEHGHRLVVRNGHAPARTLATGVGQVEVVRLRVDDRRLDAATGERVQFHSVILPRWCRRSPKVAEVLPLLYLHGLSSLDFVPALGAFFGAAAGLSALGSPRSFWGFFARRSTCSWRQVPLPATRDTGRGAVGSRHRNMRRAHPGGVGSVGAGAPIR